MLVAADCFSVEIEFRGVNADGQVVRRGVLQPSPLRAAEGRVVLALWIQQHYPAIVRVADPVLDACDELRAGLGVNSSPETTAASSQREGVDAPQQVALVAPLRSKPDQWGEVHCPFPVTLTYDATEPITPPPAS